VTRTSSSFLPGQEQSGPRRVDEADFARFERYAAEIFEAFGMDPPHRDAPGKGGRATRRRRFVEALYDATSGYDGDAKLRTAFPTERPEGASGATVRSRRADRVLCAVRATTRSVQRRRARRIISPGSEILGSRS